MKLLTHLIQSSELLRNTELNQLFKDVRTGVRAYGSASSAQTPYARRFLENIGGALWFCKTCEQYATPELVCPCGEEPETWVQELSRPLRRDSKDSPLKRVPIQSLGIHEPIEERTSFSIH